MEIRLTKATVEVFFHGSRVASHSRASRQLRNPVTQPEHMPMEHRKYLSRVGSPIEQISAMMHHTYRTIQNYLSPDYCVTDGHYNARIPGKLAPYEKELIRCQGLTYP